MHLPFHHWLMLKVCMIFIEGVDDVLEDRQCRFRHDEGRGKRRKFNVPLENWWHYASKNNLEQNLFEALHSARIILICSHVFYHISSGTDTWRLWRQDVYLGLYRHGIACWMMIINACDQKVRTSIVSYAPVSKHHLVTDWTPNSLKRSFCFCKRRFLQDNLRQQSPTFKTVYQRNL